MKKILRGPMVYRIKCMFCDTEFEYDFSEVTTAASFLDMVVQCPTCKAFLKHKDSISTPTEMKREDSMFT